jgi:hypothetical protein
MVLMVVVRPAAIVQCNATRLFQPPAEPHQPDAATSSSPRNPENLETGFSLQLSFLTATNMAERRSQAQRPLLTQEELKKKLEVTNFDPNAILRGAQLTVVGGA